MNDVSTTPAVFNFNTHSVRTIIKDGEPWFVASDVCKALGYLNTSKAVGDHLDADERMIALVPRTPNDSLGVETNAISESGLYALVLRSRKPEARKFAKWVTSEVLPAIRKTGKFDVKTACGPLTKEMRDAIKNMVMERAKGLPHAKQAGAVVKAWSALKSHFGVTYKDIPADKYTEALSLVARMQVEWEIVDEVPAVKPSYHYPLSAADPHDRKYGNDWLSPRVLTDPKNRALELEVVEQLQKDGHDVMGLKMRIIALRDVAVRSESMRSEYESLANSLGAMSERLRVLSLHHGKNVAFSGALNADSRIDRRVYGDQMP